MKKLGPISVGGTYPVRIMGILNLSPESFYKKSIKTTKNEIIDVVKQMENDGADIIDMGGMSTAPYLKTIISEREELRRLTYAIKIIQNISNIPISVDTCRSNVAKVVLEHGIDVINDISGLKYDKKMIHVLQQYDPSVVLCSYNKTATTGNISETRKFLKQSILLAKTANISKNKIVVDPAIGFFRKKGRGKFFSKISSNWALRDLKILHNLRSLKLDFPTLISISRKSFLGSILGQNDPEDRISGSLACEVLSVINGADIIRTHNPKESKHVVTIAKKLTRTNKSL